MIWIPVIVLFVATSNVLGQRCKPGNPTEIKCYSEWSEWTTCVSPYSDMTQAIAEYKRELRESRCREPLALWAATLNSKMMKHRKTLPAYKKKMGFGPSTIVAKVPLHPGQKVMMDMKPYDETMEQKGTRNTKRSRQEVILEKSKKIRYLQLQRKRNDLKNNCERDLLRGAAVMPQEFYDLSSSMGMDMPELVKEPGQENDEEWAPPASTLRIVSQKMKKPDTWQKNTAEMKESLLESEGMGLRSWKNITGDGEYFEDQEWESNEGNEEFWWELLTGNMTRFNSSSIPHPLAKYPRKFQVLQQILLKYTAVTSEILNITMDLDIMDMVTNASLIEEMIYNDLMMDQSSEERKDKMNQLNRLSKEAKNLRTEADTIIPNSIASFHHLDPCPILKG